MHCNDYSSIRLFGAHIPWGHLALPPLEAEYDPRELSELQLNKRGQGMARAKRVESDRDPHDRRSSIAMFVLRYGGLLLILGGLGGLLGWAADLIQLNLVPLLVLVPGLIGAGLLAILFSGRLDALSAKELMAKDPRPPIIYLRSFASDRGFATPSGLELQMRFGLSSLGPTVALGRPGDRLPIIGVPRLYTSDDDWQSQVSEWLEQAALVVILAGLTEGLDWELREVGRVVSPQRIVVIPTHSQDEWTGFMERFPMPLLQVRDDDCLFYFRPSGEPVRIGHPRPRGEKAWYECHEVWTPILEQLGSSKK